MFSVNLRDRTAEFFRVTERIREHRKAELGPRSKGVAGATHPLSSGTTAKNFSQAASTIGRGISDTAERLQALAKLVQQKSLFNDPAAEIDKLTFVIKQDLQTLASELDILEQYVQEHRTGQKQADSHSETVVSTLKSQVANATKDFTQVLQMRSKNLKAQTDRRKQFGTTRRLPQRNRGALTAISNPDGGADEFQPLMNAQTVQMIEQKDTTDQYLRSRAEAVQNIEQTIQELTQMYQRLATLVSLQNEVVVRIDDGMEHTLENVKAGHSELLKYFDNVSSNRWLILKVFALLILFAIFFIVFIA